ncbi:hypothetical protein MMC12_008615 [Toensbergia leucococca]|nr:hypothetical protein [Toensbergia leucococca]
MATCEHLAWLHVTNAKEITLLNPGRMTRVIDELTKPATQQPSILLFLGRKAKNLAVRELFPENNIRKGQRDGLATLRVDNSSLYSDYPILFAESDPITTISSAANLSSCHETESISLQWSKVTAVHDLYDILHARLFCLFTDVLCVFAEDFATFDDVVKRLKAWAAAGSASNLCKQIRPRVVIIKRGSEPSPSPTYNYLETQDLHFNLHQQDLMEFYSSITVLHLADEQISPLARFRRLKELLWRQMDEMRQERRKNRCLYSAVHLNDFFEKAVAHTAASIVQPFDFILASRQNNAVGSDYQDHLTSFLRLGTKHKISYDVMMGFIASTILLDAYPPLMHSKTVLLNLLNHKLNEILEFGSELYYETIYHHSCSKSLINSYKEQLFTERQVEEQAREQEEHVKTYLNNLFSDMISSGKTAAQMHREKIKNLSISWSKLKSNKTCLWCLRRRPENTLSCGHAICNVCVRIFGTEMPILECQYYVRACLLCHFGDLTVRLKPFSAGHRILCIDGGGTRGVLPFERLAIIQDIMGPEYPLQDLFDIAFGTSVGSLLLR